MTTTQNPSKTPAKSTAAKKTPAKRTAAQKAAPVRFNHEDLPQTGSVQLRHGGEYKPSLRALVTFAKSDPTLTGHAKALVHLGWVKPGGNNTASKSPACKTAEEAGLPAEAWTVGEPAGPQIAANLRALAEAGAPEEALDGLWAAYVGGDNSVL